MMKFQYYPARVNSKSFIGFVSLDYFLNSQKNPKPRTKNIFNAISLAERIGDMDAKSKLKQENLYYFTPSVIVNKVRRYDDIKSFTGLAVLDFDHIDNAEEFKEYIFNEYKFIIASWLSPSKKGVKSLVKIPISENIDVYKEYFYALTTIFEVYDGWDSSNKNAVLPLFQSWDENLFMRSDYTEFSQRKVDPKIIKYDSVKVAMPVNTQGKERLIYAIADSAISSIGPPGHPQLRSACIALGGYVASGYIDKFSLIRHIESLISANGYLRKGVSGYIKTAHWAIDEGMKTPIKL